MFETLHFPPEENIKFGSIEPNLTSDPIGSTASDRFLLRKMYILQSDLICTSYLDVVNK